jgi:rod shape-determining protein MreD
MSLLPDFVMLTTLYWVIHHPRHVNIGTAWFLGLVMDVADGSLLGHYALAYALTAFLALFLRRRVLMFPPAQQALHILPLLLFSQTIILLIKMTGGAAWTGTAYFLSSLTGALLWPFLPGLMQFPQRRRLKTDPQ